MERDLTLTSVVFEFKSSYQAGTGKTYLTLTSVVFELIFDIDWFWSILI